MTRTSIWIARRPEDELADRIAAADRRKTLDGLIRHIVVDDAPEPAAGGECRWCPTRRQLASMPDGASRMPQFGRLMASPASRRAVGEPCGRCTRTALDVVKRRVDAGRPKNFGGAAQGSAGALTSSPSTPSTPGPGWAAPPDRRTRLHDPFGTCSTCKEYRRTHPGAALTASGVPEGCLRHVWNEKPRPPKWAR